MLKLYGFPWVLLKQEYFISKPVTLIDKGVLIAIGAAFNSFLGNEIFSRAPIWMRKMHLEWLFRVVKEPSRLGKRAFNYAYILPRLVIEERKKIRK